MTPKDHNKVIGIMHLIYGGFNALLMLVFVAFFLLIMGAAATDAATPSEVKAVFGFMGVFVLAFAAVFGIPPILAGYAMLKRKRWARVMGFISACVCALSFPFGTALCVYTLWFLSGPGEHFHKGGAELAGQGWRATLPGASTFGREAQSWARPGRQQEYVPPPQPPDWRGE